MTTRTARRKRIIRVRSVEHQLAEAKLARANGELANLVELAQRLETLRVDLALAKGAVAGRALNTSAQPAMRLVLPHASLTPPRARASHPSRLYAPPAPNATVQAATPGRPHHRTRPGRDAPPGGATDA